jgi:hypothetical protein
MIVLSIVEFAARRRGDQDSMEKDLYPDVSEALARYPATNWETPLLAEVSRLYIDTYHREGGKGRPKNLDSFLRDVRATLDKTKDPTEATADRISVWLSTAILNAATQEAASTDEEFLVMEWVTMHDKDVRPAHKDAEGQQRPPGEPFDVGGSHLAYPGDPTAPIELWINCRCTLAPVLGSEAARTTEGVTMTSTETEQDQQVAAAPLQWHGVLAPEGVWSGDGRKFAEGALRFRDLPIPLTWQKSTDNGHDGSIVVGKIETIERVDGMMRGSGTFLAIPEADEVVGLIAEFGRFGVSVDADDAEFEFDDEEGKVTFTSARIASASVVSIPAFAEAFVALGPWADGGDGMEPTQDVCDPQSEAYDEEACAQKEAGTGYQINHGFIDSGMSITYNGPTNGTWMSASSTTTFVSDKPWSGFSQSDYTPAQWKAACCLHRSQEVEPKSNHGLPIKEPGGALNRNGVHAAASRFGQTQGPAEAKAAAKACIRGAYRQIGEEPPDSLKSSDDTDVFGRGPGWITHPIATKRIHDYWTKKGEEGYAKVGWGAPGDFNRCRVEVGEEIAENSPESTKYLNQICAQWHHDALGIWPGEHHAADLPDGDPAPSIELVASAARRAPAGWFADPNLTGPTHLTITEDGRVYGHIAEWTACHIGYEGVCVSPPTSASDYAYFATGRVLLDDGSAARTGVISLGGGHAGQRASARAAIAHYDSTSAAVADVCVGEDDHGIWCAGWVRPGVTEEQVIALRASDVSGDWREIRGESEMVAALAVNVGGFPTVGIEDGLQVSLVAAGMVHKTDETPQAVEWLAAAVEKAIVDRQARRDRMAELRKKVLH